MYEEYGTYLQNPWAISPAPPYCPTRNAAGPYLPILFKYRRVRSSADEEGSEGDEQCEMAYAIRSAKEGGREKVDVRRSMMGVSACPVVSVSVCAIQNPA